VVLSYQFLSEEHFWFKSLLWDPSNFRNYQIIEWLQRNVLRFVSIVLSINFPPNHYTLICQPGQNSEQCIKTPENILYGVSEQTYVWLSTFREHSRRLKYSAPYIILSLVTTNYFYNFPVHNFIVWRTLDENILNKYYVIYKINLFI